MKTVFKICTLILLPLCGISSAKAQSADMFNQVFGGTGYEYGYSVKQTLDNGYIVAGTTSSFGNGTTDGYLVKTDSLGLAQWQHTYGGGNIDVFHAIVLLPDSGFMIAGYTNSYGSGGYDGWMLRLDKNGDTLWTKTIGTTDWDFLVSVDTLKDTSGFIFCGSTFGLGAGDEDFFVVKTNLLGDTIWTRTYGGVKQDIPHQVVCNGDSAISIIGNTKSFGDSLGDIWLMRIKYSNGDTLWTRREGLPAHADEGWTICDRPAFSRMIIAGMENTVNAGDQAYANEYFYDGNEVVGVELLHGGSARELYRSSSLLPNGSTVFAGTTFSYGGGLGDIYFWNTTMWCFTTYGTLKLDEGYSIDATRDTGAIICGYTEGFNSYLPNMYLVKVNSACGSTLVIGIHENGATAGFGTAVKIYPQPLSDQSQVLISGTETLELNNFRFDVYDMAGRYLGNYAKPGSLEQSSPKTASLIIERNQLTAGCYMYNISSGNGIIGAGKLIVAGQ